MADTICILRFLPCNFKVACIRSDRLTLTVARLTYKVDCCERLYAIIYCQEVAKFLRLFLYC